MIIYGLSPTPFLSAIMMVRNRAVYVSFRHHVYQCCLCPCNVALANLLGMKTFVMPHLTGANPGFQERGFECIKVWGFALLILSHFSKIHVSHENGIIWSH